MYIFLLFIFPLVIKDKWNCVRGGHDVCKVSVIYVLFSLYSIDSYIYVHLLKITTVCHNVKNYNCVS